MRQFSFLLIIIIILFSCHNDKQTTSTYDSQNINANEKIEISDGATIKLDGGCGYNYGTGNIELIVNDPGQRELNQINTILQFSGLVTNYKIFSASIENAIATIINGERYIIYDPRLLTHTDINSGDYWSSISILAHEIGHHLSGHTMSNIGSNPIVELEADKFSGYVLYKMGATISQATHAMQLLGSEQDSYSHPSKYKRIQSIQNGWREASDQRYKSAIPPPPLDEEETWYINEFFKEDLICSKALSDPIYGGVIDSYDHPVLEGIIIDVTRKDPSYGGKAELCKLNVTDNNLIVTIELTKVSPSPFEGTLRRIGQREKFYITEYFQMGNVVLDGFEAVVVPGRKIRFKSFYFGYGAEDIFYLKKLNRNGSNDDSPIKENVTNDINSTILQNFTNANFSGCSCWIFDNINNSNNNRSYLIAVDYAGDWEDRIAYVKYNNKLTSLNIINTSIKENSFGIEEYFEVYKNEEIEIEVIYKKKTGQGEETYLYDIIITSKYKQKVEKIVTQGVCGC